MKEKSLSEREIEDFLDGAEILGTGGGGIREWANMMLQFMREKDKEFRIVDPREVPEDALIVGAGGVGGGMEEEVREKILKKFHRLPLESPRTSEIMESAHLAEKMMIGHKGEEISAFLAYELGCATTILSAVAAALSDKPVIDGDCVGRSVPEMELSTLNIMDIPFTPMAIVTPWMETMMVKKVVDYSRAEDICRYMAVVSGGLCIVMGSPIRGKILSDSIVCNTLTKAINLGKSIRLARDKGREPIKAAVKSLGAYLLFKGRVTSFRREDRGGFVWGEHKYEGVDEFEGKNFRIWYKNENLISFLDERPYVCGPDLLCVMDSKTGKGVSNWGPDFTEGGEVSVIGVKADRLWRSKRGLEVFNPRHFGFDLDYKPIEEFF